MDRITLTGQGAPAVVQSGGAIAVASRSAPVMPVERVSTGSGQQGRLFADQAKAGNSEELSAEEIQRRAVEAVRGAINEAGAAIDAGARLVIRKDDDTGRFVYEFRDSGTDEVVKQFPAEEVLRALASFRQAMTGKVLDRQA